MTQVHKEIDLKKIFLVLKQNSLFIGITTATTTLIAIIYCFLATPIFTASVLINPPKLSEAGTSVSQIMGGLNVLSGGSILSQKTDADIMMAILNSNTVKDMIIKHFNLIKTFKVGDIELARRTLAGMVSFNADLKSGFVSIDVYSNDPQMATKIANFYTLALGQAINNIAYNRAHQRFTFYQQQLKLARASLYEAENALRLFAESNGILAGQQAQVIAALSTHLQEQLVIAQTQQKTASYYLSQDSADYKAQQTKIEALRAQLNQLNNQNIEDDVTIPAGLAPTLARQYIGLMREFTFRQMIFEVMFKQAKAAQLDTQSELVPLALQVIDPATVPLYKSGPKRLKITLNGLFIGLLLSCLAVLLYHRTLLLKDPTAASEK